jgi:hypothetical protein
MHGERISAVARQHWLTGRSEICCVPLFFAACNRWYAECQHSDVVLEPRSQGHRVTTPLKNGWSYNMYDMPRQFAPPGPVGRAELLARRELCSPN